MKVTFTPKTLALITTPLAFGLLGACGGGGGGGFSGGIADGGIRGTGSSVGPVSGFGSVFVNGIRFETDGNVESNDGITSESQLDKGMILRVDGEWRTDGSGSADEVEYDDTFRGEVTGVTVTETSSSGEVRAGQLTLLGQTIAFDRRTVFNVPGGFTDSGSIAGKLVRVSAWSTGSSYRASYVGVIDNLPNQYVELEGFAGNVNLDEKSFSVGTQAITYIADDVFLDGVRPEDLSDGSRQFEIEGTTSGGEILAETIRFADSRRFLGTEDEDIELTGPVEGYDASASEFRVNGVTIVITSQTEFDDISRSRLQDGFLVRVEGEFRNGAVIAEEIELLEGDSEVEARVLGAGTRPDSWNIGGVTVVITTSTLIEYDDGLTAISQGVNADVEGIERTVGSETFLEALNMEVETSGDDEFEMTGRWSWLSEGSVLTVLGLNLSVGPGAIEDPIDGCEFVEVEYRQSGAGFLAEEVDCEGEEDDD